MVDKNLIKVGAKFKALFAFLIVSKGDTIQILNIDEDMVTFIIIETGGQDWFSIGGAALHYIQPIESHVDIILW